MSKVRNFSEMAPNIAFPEFNFYELYYSTFEKSKLGRIKKLLPLRETEILYIFFGIHAENVVQRADRIEQRSSLAAA